MWRNYEKYEKYSPSYSIECITCTLFTYFDVNGFSVPSKTNNKNNNKNDNNNNDEWKKQLTIAISRINWYKMKIKEIERNTIV